MAEHPGGYKFSPGAQRLTYRDMDYIVSKRGSQYEWAIFPPGATIDSVPQPIAAGPRFRAAVDAARAAIDLWREAHPEEAPQASTPA